MPFLNKKFLTLLIIITGFLIVQSVLAFTPSYNQYLQQAAGTSGANYPSTQANENFINTKIGQIIGGVVGLIGIIFLGLTVYSGIQWMTAGGNEEAVNKSKKRVVNGTIGVGLTLCAFLLANLYFGFFEQKFLNPGPLASVNTPPQGFENIVCQTDAQCADRTGPTTGEPMTCYGTPPNGICGECDNDDDCPDLYECDLPTYLCIPDQDLTCDQLTSMGPGQCIFDPDCKWVPDPTQEEWGVGNCVDNDASDCPQCTEDKPFCCDADIGQPSNPKCEGSFADACVECITEDTINNVQYNNCESYGTGLNFCQETSHTCTF